MDCAKIGKLIYTLRKEKGLTQKELADSLNISDRAVSKWERGIGAPDISLVSELAEILGVSSDKILSGEIAENKKDNGNIKKTKFYVCKACGNILTSTGDADIICCGRKAESLKVQKADEEHKAEVSMVDGEYYITFSHDMTKGHYISFVAAVGYDRSMIVKLYPEQDAYLRMPKLWGASLYAYCSEHGLFRI